MAAAGGATTAPVLTPEIPPDLKEAYKEAGHSYVETYRTPMEQRVIEETTQQRLAMMHALAQEQAMMMGAQNASAMQQQMQAGYLDDTIRAMLGMGNDPLMGHQRMTQKQMNDMLGGLPSSSIFGMRGGK